MKIDPFDEAVYRRKSALNYLNRANNAFKNKDLPGCILFSQLTVENAAKAVISIFKLPSWSHDPSSEIKDVLKEYAMEISKKNSKLIDMLSELAETSHLLAPEHGRATYGEPEKRLTPEDIYVLKDAEKTLEEAKKSIGIMEEFLNHWKTK